MKLKDLRNEIKVLDIPALLQRAKALKVEISDLIMDKNMNKLKDLKAIFKKKKEVARVLTVLSQKTMIGDLESRELKGVEGSKAEKSKEMKGAKKQ